MFKHIATTIAAAAIALATAAQPVHAGPRLKPSTVACFKKEDLQAGLLAAQRGDDRQIEYLKKTGKCFVTGPFGYSLIETADWGSIAKVRLWLGLKNLAEDGLILWVAPAPTGRGDER